MAVALRTPFIIIMSHRSRRRRRAASNLAPSLVTAVITAAGFVVASGASLCLASSRINDSDPPDSSSRTMKSWDPSDIIGRRMRGESVSLRGGSSSNRDSVNLLVKYKNTRARSLSGNNSGDSTSSKWQAHALSISTISEERHIEVVGINAGELDLVVKEMMADDNVELVEEDFPMYIERPYNEKDKPAQPQRLRNRTLAEIQEYGLRLVKAPQVWSLTKSRPNRYPNTPVKVCIVDTGYDEMHPDLPKSGVTFTKAGYGNPLQDGDGHGTHCAGVIGAVGNNGRGIIGVNPDPSKFSFHISKALNDEGMGTASSVLLGIEGCINSGSRIISMSLGGGPYSEIFRRVYEDAYDAGVLVFAAAGNLGLNRDDYPASYSHVVSVGGVGPLGVRADFSNWNSQLEIMAPGVNIRSTIPGGGYGALSGTSMATPFAAGVAALIWGYFPQCSNQQIRNVMAHTAKRMTADGSECDKRTGFGLIQAKDAFDLLDRYGCAAGGINFNPLSMGGVGGCAQPLADVSKLKPVRLQQSGISTGPPSTCKKLFLRLVTDDYAYENSWKLVKVRSDGTIIDTINTGPPQNRNFADNTEYNGPASGCLDPGIYQFFMYDLYGDGIKSPGYYSISLSGKTLRSNNIFTHQEVTSFTIGNLESPAKSLAWTLLLSESFGDGFGQFTDGGANTMYISTKFKRNGLVMVKNGGDISSVYSKNVQLIGRDLNGIFRVEINFYSNNLGPQDGFCLDYSPNRSSQWILARCWRNGQDFQNGEWNDNVRHEFRPTTEPVNSIRIRLRGNSRENMDRVFFDAVQLFGQAEVK